jgi:hypothetical protein
MDGLPTACSRVLRAINNGQGDKVRVYGLSTSPELSQFTASYASITTFPGGSHTPPNHPYINDNRKFTYAYSKPPEHVIIPGPQFGFEPNPQNSPSGQDPRSISAPPNKTCSLTVSFEQGTFYNGNGELPNGPSSNKTLGYDSYGLGFTISGKVASGGIGKIGDDPNPENPKGRWKIYQLTADRITANGQVIRDQELRSDLNTQSYYDASGKTFSWYDHPGSPTPGDLIKGYERNMKFQVSAYDGRHFCSVTFSATFTFNGAWSVHWKKGY